MIASGKDVAYSRAELVPSFSADSELDIAFSETPCNTKKQNKSNFVSKSPQL